MKAPEMFEHWKAERKQERLSVMGDLLFYLANHVSEPQLENGARVLDISDVKEFLFNLANEADDRRML